MINIVVTLEEHSVETAAQWSNAIEGRVTGANPRGGKDFLPGTRYVVGYLGEFGVGLALKRYGLRFVYNADLSGRGQEPEFTVWMNGEARTLDVKSSPTLGDLYLHDATLEKSGVADLYVRTIVREREVTMVGWATGKRLSETESIPFGRTGEPAKVIWQRDLEPMGNLIHLLDTGCAQYIGP